MTKVPLKILCLQCSEFTCEKPKTSESVSFRSIFLETPSKYDISSSFKANPSLRLKAVISSIKKMGSGLIFIENIF